jgi:hypothetical protein
MALDLPLVRMAAVRPTPHYEKPMRAQPEIQRALALLDELGAEDTDHPRGTLSDHLRGTYDVLVGWGCERDVCLAGLYHSVYGTDIFETVTLTPDARDKVLQAIGADAEQLAYLYCALERESLYDNLTTGGPPYGVRSRLDGAELRLGRDDYAGLLAIDLANRLEQVPHSRASRAQFADDRARYLAAVPLLPPAAVTQLRSTKISLTRRLFGRPAHRVREVLRG